MKFDVPTMIALVMILAALFSARGGGTRGGARRVWRSSYAVIFMTVAHLAFLYQFPSAQIGHLNSEAWAAITAAAIAGVASDDDADAVGLLLALLGGVQVLLLAGLLDLRTAGV